MIKTAIRKNIIFIVVIILTALAVFLILMYSNIGFLNILTYFEKPDIYEDKIILFYSKDCSHCAKVDSFIEGNKIEGKIAFTRLNVNEDSNANILADKAQICGVDVQKIGIPFLWNGPAQKCVLGYADVIKFFQEKVSKK